MRLFGKQIAPADAALALTGVLGAACFFVLLPGQHPDAAADYRLEARQATARSRAVLEENGYPVEALETYTQRFGPNEDVLRSIQQALGRPQTVDALRRAAADSGAAGGLPAYGWRITWHDKDAGSDEAGDDFFHLSLDERGRLWKLSGTRDASRRRPGLNREALAAALPGGEGADSLDALPDSVMKRYLRFDRSLRRPARPAKHAPPDTSQAGSETDSEADSETDSETDVEALVEAFRQRGDGSMFAVPSLGRAAARRLARYHLSRSALAGLGLRADSLWADEDEPGRRAHVRFSGAHPVWGQRVEATVEVTSLGALRSLEPNVEAAPGGGPAAATAGGAAATVEGEEDPNSITLSAEGTATGAVYITYGALFLLIAVLFFRRLSARAIDAQAALRDALWGGIFAGTAMGLLVSRDILRQAPGRWASIGIVALVVLSVGLGGALSMFVLSSPADSLAREVWPRKLQSLSLLRRLAVRNVPVGAALLRGAALGGVLVGLATLVLVLFPQAALTFGDVSPAFLSSLTASPFGYLFATYAWVSLAYMLLVLLGWGSLLQRWTGRAVPAAAGVVAVFVLGQAGPYALAPVGYDFVLAGALGTALATAFWRYDALTCFTGYLLMGLLWGTAPGWLIDGFPGQVDFLAALATVGVALGLGLAGVFSGRTGEEAGTYMPAYLTELAERERLERDIEIAQQVQRDFLPRRMPQVEGLDLAALCLPAREVGGDYYDFIALPDGRLGVVVGDVSGKGIEASFFMTLAKGFLQTLATEERTPAEVLRRLNALFRRNAPRGTFITMIYGVVDPAEGTFRFARAGHNPLAHCCARDGGRRTVDGGSPAENGQPERKPRQPDHDPRTTLLRPRGMAIGLADGASFDDALEEVTLPLAEGDALVLYTDGFPEARGPDGEEFGEERIRERIQRHGHYPAQQLLQTLADDVHAFVEATGRHDDMTMVVLKRTTSTAPAGGAPSAEASRGAGKQNRAEEARASAPS